MKLEYSHSPPVVKHPWQLHQTHAVVRIDNLSDEKFDYHNVHLFIQFDCGVTSETNVPYRMCVWRRRLAPLSLYISEDKSTAFCCNYDLFRDIHSLYKQGSSAVYLVWKAFPKNNEKVAILHIHPDHAHRVHQAYIAAKEAAKRAPFKHPHQPTGSRSTPEAWTIYTATGKPENKATSAIIADIPAADAHPAQTATSQENTRGRTFGDGRAAQTQAGPREREIDTPRNNTGAPSEHTRSYQMSPSAPRDGAERREKDTGARERVAAHSSAERHTLVQGSTYDAQSSRSDQDSSCEDTGAAEADTFCSTSASRRGPIRSLERNRRTQRWNPIHASSGCTRPRRSTEDGDDPWGHTGGCSQRTRQEPREGNPQDSRLTHQEAAAKTYLLYQRIRHSLAARATHASHAKTA